MTRGRFKQGWTEIVRIDAFKYLISDLRFQIWAFLFLSILPILSIPVPFFLRLRGYWHPLKASTSVMRL
jgi:hypothetical protein